jgi:molecular chaperone HscB
MTSRGRELPPSYFALLDLEPRFALSMDELDRAYRALASRVHPDRFANGTVAERRDALERTTRANEAYRTLRAPVLRARHLLKLRGIDVDAYRAAPAAFLSAQFEWREKLGDARAARDEAALQALDAAARKQAGDLNARLAAQLDASPDDAGAVASVLQLMFLEKLLADVGDAREALEA